MSAVAILKAVSVLTDLFTLGNEMLAAHAELQKLIEKAKADGRDHLTEEEWAQVTALDDAARAKLAEAIAKAKAGP